MLHQKELLSVWHTAVDVKLKTKDLPRLVKERSTLAAIQKCIKPKQQVGKHWPISFPKRIPFLEWVLDLLLWLLAIKHSVVLFDWAFEGCIRPLLLGIIQLVIIAASWRLRLIRTTCVWWCTRLWQTVAVQKIREFHISAEMQLFDKMGHSRPLFSLFLSFRYSWP